MPFSRACAEVAEWQADPQWARKSPVRKDPLQPPVRWLVLPPPVQHRLRKGHLPVKVSHSDEITYLLHLSDDAVLSYCYRLSVIYEILKTKT